MNLATLLASLLASVTDLQSAAADLQSAGAIRSEQWTRWQSMRTGMDQLADQLRAAGIEASTDAAAESPEAISQRLLHLEDAVGDALVHLDKLAAALLPAAPAEPTTAQG